MTDYNIHLLHTVVHKFTGLQIYPGNETQVFTQGEAVPEESFVDLSIRSTFVIAPQELYLQTHFQVDDIRLPEDENQLGYRLQFCLFAIFEVGETESKARVEQFAQRHLPNLLAPLASDTHYRFASILQPGVIISKLQPYISDEALRSFIKQHKITFTVAPESISHIA